MKIGIESNIIRNLLKDAYFITGTAYAGKSTAVKLLSEKYAGICCGENYHSSLSFATDVEHQPNLNYFHTMKSWLEFVSRTPEDYDAWISGVSIEAAELELIILLSLAREGRKLFVDTNIPLDILWEIAPWEHVAVMLCPPAVSVERFFDRDDEDKRFLYNVIESAPESEAVMRNFRACVARINSPENYREYEQSGFYTLIRDDCRSADDTADILAAHFKL